MSQAAKQTAVKGSETRKIMWNIMRSFIYFMKMKLNEGIAQGYYGSRSKIPEMGATTAARKIGVQPERLVWGNREKREKGEGRWDGCGIFTMCNRQHGGDMQEMGRKTIRMGKRAIMR